MKGVGFVGSVPLARGIAWGVPQDVCGRKGACVMRAKARAGGKKKGFGKVAGGVRAGKGAGGAQEKAADEKEGKVEADAAFKERGRGVVREGATGQEGDETPHRAAVGGVVELEDPVASVLDRVREEVVCPERWGEGVERVPWGVSVDATVEIAAGFWERGLGEDGLGGWVRRNRDLVSEPLLYRFTSAILQVEDRGGVGGEVERMRALRRDLIALCWSYDLGLKKALLRAEERLMGVLQGENVKRDVERFCGETQLDVDAFWIVVYAAVAAWEERGKANPELVNVDVQAALTAAAEACRASGKVAKLLSPALAAMQSVLVESDPVAQGAIVAEIDDDVVPRIGVFVEQIRLFPVAAYGGLLRRIQAIHQYILSSRYAVENEGLVPLRFNVPRNEIVSRLVSFSKKSNSVRRL